ncbi:MAG: hypothetical protein ACFE89_08135 [Candidatus Hodarchaeota archaeon]
MNRHFLIISLLSILIIPLTSPFINTVLTQECFVQIVAVNIDQPSYQIGEPLFVTLVYDMYYESSDPLGAGSISVSLIVQGNPLPIQMYQFTDLGLSVNKTVSFEITPTDWEPNSTGQIGVVQVQGWVQDSSGTMIDTAELQFSVFRGDLVISTSPLPAVITFHDLIQLQGLLQNSHNASILVPLHPLRIAISQETQIIQTWDLNTSQTSTFAQEIDTSQSGTGTFDCNITALSTGDYSSAMHFFSFDILNSSLTLTSTLNTTIVQAYYPLTNNCSIQVSALIYCQTTNHSLQEANLSCTLDNATTPMNYDSPNHFSAEIFAPNTPGNYTLTIKATVPHHNFTTMSISIQVFTREALLSIESNCSEAAIGDIIEFTLSAKDKESLIAIQGKICSIYLYNQSMWNLLAQTALDSNGIAHFLWQAQNVGDQDFQFKMVFQGGPEFKDGETELFITNTHEIRFILDSTIQVLRQTTTEYFLQLTTLDYQPLTNVDIQFVESSTNTTWCTAITNTSGYASLIWFIEAWYDLGFHEFSLTAQQGTLVLGVILITMIVFDQTVLELV